MPAIETVTDSLYLRGCDATQRSRYRNEVAQSHRSGSRLVEVCPTVDRDRETAVTSAALTLPEGGTLTSSWPETLPGADPLPGQLDRWLAARGAELVAVRRHIHAHPELSGHEFETAGLVYRELAVAGLQPKLLPRGNGVICDIGHGDRVIALRADLDALPLPDIKDVPYRSQVPGVSHACGHDVHTRSRTLPRSTRCTALRSCRSA